MVNSCMHMCGICIYIFDMDMYSSMFNAASEYLIFILLLLFFFHPLFVTSLYFYTILFMFGLA